MPNVSLSGWNGQTDLLDNGVITTDIEPTKEGIIAVLDKIQEERPDASRM